jgi:uncharacterized protein (DUF1499 family)
MYWEYVGILSVIVAVGAFFRYASNHPINDICTDGPLSPLEYITNVPNSEPNLKFLRIQRKYYPHLAPLRLNSQDYTLESVYNILLQTAKSMPNWSIVATDEATLRIQAVATTPLMRFKDDVVIKVGEIKEFSEIVVEMRSKSRVGKVYRSLSFNQLS